MSLYGIRYDVPTSLYVVRVQVLLGCVDLSPPHVSGREEHLAVDV